MPTEKEVVKEYESLKQRKDNKIFHEICCLSLVEEEYNGEDFPNCFFSSPIHNEYLTIAKFMQQIHNKIISEAHYDYEGANPDELFLNLHNIFLSIYRYKTVEEFVRERFLEEEQKKAEQEQEYKLFLELKEKYDS